MGFHKKPEENGFEGTSLKATARLPAIAPAGHMPFVMRHAPTAVLGALGVRCSISRGAAGLVSTLLLYEKLLRMHGSLMGNVFFMECFSFLCLDLSSGSCSLCGQ